jgi:hypothetical protein
MMCQALHLNSSVIVRMQMDTMVPPVKILIAVAIFAKIMELVLLLMYVTVILPMVTMEPTALTLIVMVFESILRTC